MADNAESINESKQTGNKTRVKKIALVGIDGAGKSTIMARFMALVPSLSSVDAKGIFGLTCPQFHETQNVPLKDLSLALDLFSKESDRLGNFELKAFSMYLQMTLYAPIENFIQDTFSPQIVVSERHPVIDTLAYGPFYKALIHREPDMASLERPLREAIDGVVPGGFAAIQDWCQRHNAKTGRSIEFKDMPFFLRDLFSRPLSEVVDSVLSQYQTGFPDIVVMLDPGMDVALKRIAQRSQGGEKELHENAESLGHLRESYLGLMQNIQSLLPQIQTFVIDTGIADVDEAVRHIIEKVGLNQT